jgi:3-dehydroquinate synthase
VKHRTIRVDLGDRSYPVYLGDRVIASLGPLCRRHRGPDRIVVLADSNRARVALRKALASLTSAGFDPLPIIMPPGEQQKTPDRVSRIHAKMLAAGIPRQGAMLALGGGMVGDVAGFTAATYRRGLMLVQCPTTLLSQVDSSIGGKNGVNHPAAKNAVGTFLQPRFVLSDVRLLRTLPRRDLIAGVGEVLKYAFVGAPDLLDTIAGNIRAILRTDPETLLGIAARCLRVKARLVSFDEKELLQTRGRILLNAGHAVGHALESLSGYRIRHGEGVFLGLLVEGHLAWQRGWLPARTLRRLAGIYHDLGARFTLDEITDRALVRSLASGKSTRFVLPCGRGTVKVVHDVTEKELTEAIGAVRSFHFIDSR